MKREIMMAALGVACTSAWAAETVTRDKINALLKDLADKPAPTNLAPAAMCYEMAMPPQRAEYVCPTCGAKTLHNKASTAQDATWTVESFRASTKKLVELGLTAKLDETFLCSACRKKDVPDKFFLEVTMDGKVIRNSVQGKDFALLESFLSGKRAWEGDYGKESPLKGELPRIRLLLGVAAPSPKAP
jgi:hypothetical protein